MIWWYQFIIGEVPEPAGDEVKAAHKRSMAKDKRIIADSIKDDIIPDVPSYKTLLYKNPVTIMW